jgi:hypothetical protein
MSMAETQTPASPKPPVAGGGDEIGDWIRAGRPIPPPHAVKSRNLLVLADLFNIDTMVETGTSKGAMIAATLDRFTRIYSIEVQPQLAANARARFAAVPDKVTIIEGDSGVKLPELLASGELPERVLFWLDGHYSGGGTGKAATDTPIVQEIEAISKYRKHADVILVDDARLFRVKSDYPTRDEMFAALRRLFGRGAVMADDAFILLPAM